MFAQWERQAPKTDIRANVSLQGTGTKITADEETAKMAIDAVKAIPGLNFAGVDIMKVNSTDEKGAKLVNRYLIELNSNPGEQIIDITGHNYFEELLDFVEENYKNKEKRESAAFQSPSSEKHGSKMSEAEFLEYLKTHDSLDNMTKMRERGLY